MRLARPFQLAALLAATAGAQVAPGGAALAIADGLLEAHVPRSDDADRAAAALLETARVHAQSPAAALLVEAVQRMLQDVQRPADLLAAIERLLAAKPHGLAAQAARGLQSSLLVHSARAEEAVALDPFRDHAAALLAVGPFGDQGDYYTDKVFAPQVRFPRADESLPGRYGPVRPRLVERAPLERTLQLAPRGEPRPGCFYALHQADAEGDVFAYLEIECRGSFEVFLNGERLAAVDRHAVRSGPRHWLPAWLRAGRNHVVLKTTLASYSEIALRYVDAAGQRLRGVVAAADQSDVRPHVAPAAGREPAPFVDGLRALVAAARNAESAQRPRLALAAALAALAQGEQDMGLAPLAEFEQAPPQGVLALALAIAVLDADLLPVEVRAGRARRLAEPLRDELADHHAFVMLRARFLADDDKREEALRLLQARVDAGKAGPPTFVRLVELAQGLRFEAEERRALEAWRQRWPDDHRPVLTLADRRARAGDARGALDLLREAAARAPHTALFARIGPLAADCGEAELALEALAKTREGKPDDAVARAARADLLRRLGRLEPSLEQWAEAARDPTASAAQLRTAGDWLRQGGRAAAAAAAWQRSLELDPGQHELRRELARIARGAAQAEDYPELAPYRRAVEPLIAAFVPGERERTATSSLLLDHMIVELFADGSMVEETHQLRRINDLRGVEQHQEAREAARSREVLTVRTIGTDGREYVPHRVAGSFAMPRLEPGAFIETRYRDFERSARPGPLRATRFFFQGDSEPFLLSELVVIVPAGLPGEFRTRNFAGAHRIDDLGDGRTAHVFTATDVPRLPSETQAPPLEEIAPIVTWGEDGDADAAAREAYARLVSTTFTSTLVAAKAQEIVAGIDGDSARLAAIHRWVNEEIPTAPGSSEPTSILLTRKGPRFHLELALLQAAGVPLRFAACAREREERDERPTPLFLGEESYDVLAARVEPRDGAPAWLFQDAPRSWPCGAVPAHRQRAPALLLGAGTAQLTRLPGGDPADEGFDVSSSVTLDRDGAATFAGTITLRGWIGFLLADRIRGMQDNVQKLIARQFVGQILEGWTIDDLDLAEIKQPGKPLRASGTLHKAGAAEKAGERRAMRLPLSRTEFLAQFGGRGDRELPLRLREGHADRWEVTVDPGALHRFASVPADVRVRHMLLDFELAFRLEGDKLVVRREVLLRPGTIPAAQFDEWARLLRRLDLAEDLQLELVGR
jgi:hypothetical protein